eukprot:scaffold229637_cov15-Prasinocladus_malaysianus.AAC.1
MLVHKGMTHLSSQFVAQHPPLENLLDDTVDQADFIGTRGAPEAHHVIMLAMGFNCCNFAKQR